jgi:hypothetical protein
MGNPQFDSRRIERRLGPFVQPPRPRHAAPTHLHLPSFSDCLLGSGPLSPRTRHYLTNWLSDSLTGQDTGLSRGNGRVFCATTEDSRGPDLGANRTRLGERTPFRAWLVGQDNSRGLSERHSEQIGQLEEGRDLLTCLDLAGRRRLSQLCS